MEATATVSSTESSAGTGTVADLIPNAAAEHAESTAVRFKRDGAWHDVSYAELATIVQEVGLGLIDLGIEPGERVCILANTRPEWSYADLARDRRGRGRRPDLPDQLARGVPVGDLRLRRRRDRLRGRGAAREDRRDPRAAARPAHRDRDRRAGGSSRPPTALRAPRWRSQAISLEEVRERGRSHAAEELDARRAAVRPEDPYTFIYTSGTTGPPKGCVLTHGNYRAIMDMIARESAQIDATTRSSTCTCRSRTPTRC